MTNIARAAIVAAAILITGPSAASANTVQPPVLSVTGSGSVSYQPDIARISLGVRAESASAAAAANMVNARAASVIAALRKLGIADADLTTSDYSIQYQPPDDSQPQPIAGPNSTTSVAPRRPAQGTYVATESIDVKSALSKAGQVLDAGVASGANETNGIAFDTSARTALYREALSRAVADARAQAEILAKAAGVTLAGIQSINVGAGPGPVQPLVRMQAMAAPAQIMGGTGEVDASVEVDFRIK